MQEIKNGIDRTHLLLHLVAQAFGDVRSRNGNVKEEIEMFPAAKPPFTTASPAECTRSRDAEAPQREPSAAKEKGGLEGF